LESTYAYNWFMVFALRGFGIVDQESIPRIRHNLCSYLFPIISVVFDQPADADATEQNVVLTSTSISSNSCNDSRRRTY